MKGINKSKMNKRAKGFTLTEILIALAIVAIMGTVVTLSLIGNVNKANLEKLKGDINTLKTALTSYKVDNGTYPTTEQGLEALIRRPTSEPVPQNYPSSGYLGSSAVPKDPWKRDYIYIYPGRHGDFDLYTLGNDGREGGEGENMDIGTWNLHEANFNTENQ
ncbi:type II secretion system major pseudopilin GspG [Kangiella sediminilitoris]|uniref:type II secretion system major pseudopilin GspG n=1 Tax=Kangiella sediminilitoris TaxID=1144748 RepID=UPI0009F17874|nr:type II secretion system major pseudopilin GspG [Kangiella sediminilitoris]